MIFIGVYTIFYAKCKWQHNRSKCDLTILWYSYFAGISGFLCSVYANVVWCIERFLVGEHDVFTCTELVCPRLCCKVILCRSKVFWQVEECIFTKKAHRIVQIVFSTLSSLFINYRLKVAGINIKHLV